jgi:hypothetical protein
MTATSTADADADPASRADVRAVLDLMRDVGAVKSCIDEERGGYGDVPGVFVLVGSRSSAVPTSAASVEDKGMELGVDDVDLGDGAADVPFSMGWWEDQLFDLGLYGWEVVEWDSAEQGVEKTRNKFGGKMIFSSIVLLWGFMCYRSCHRFETNLCSVGRVRRYAAHQGSTGDA